MFETISHGFTTLFNGLTSLVSFSMTPFAFAVVLVAVSLGWLGLVEIELMDREGAKPRVGRH